MTGRLQEERGCAGETGLLLVCVGVDLYDFGLGILRLWIVSLLICLMDLLFRGFVFPSLVFVDWVIFWSLDFFSGSRLTVGVGGDYIRPTTTAAPGFG
ncbi:hypothetical protein LC092_17040, partial [Stappia stellulata]|uniref:hypothetical protein n=1 Tax=Stappia stellulata TaxID=71235 RepID=UPI001CD5606E